MPLIPIGFWRKEAHTDSPDIPIAAALHFAFSNLFRAPGWAIIGVLCAFSLVAFLVLELLRLIFPLADPAFAPDTFMIRDSLHLPRISFRGIAEHPADIFVLIATELFLLGSFLVATVLQYRIALSAVRALPLSRATFAQDFRFSLMMKFGIAWLLQTLIVYFGLLLFIIPGIIWGLMFCMTLWLAVDYQLDPIAALSSSRFLTRGIRWRLLLFYLALAGIGIVLSFVVVIGLAILISAIFEFATVEEIANQGIALLLTLALLFLFFPFRILAEGFVYHWLLTARAQSSSTTTAYPES